MASFRSCRLPIHLTATVPQILRIEITRINSHVIGIYSGEELIIIVDLFLEARYGKFEIMLITYPSDSHSSTHPEDCNY